MALLLKELNSTTASSTFSSCTGRKGGKREGEGSERWSRKGRERREGERWSRNGRERREGEGRGKGRGVRDGVGRGEKEEKGRGEGREVEGEMEKRGRERREGKGRKRWRREGRQWEELCMYLVEASVWPKCPPIRLLLRLASAQEQLLLY